MRETIKNNYQREGERERLNKRVSEMKRIGTELTGKINHKKPYKIDNKRLDSN